MRIALSLALVLSAVPSSADTEDELKDQICETLAEQRIAFETDCPAEKVKLDGRALGSHERVYRFKACGSRYVCAVADSGVVNCKPLMTPGGK